MHDIFLTTLCNFRCDKVPVSALQQRREDSLLWRRLEYEFLAIVPCFLLFFFLFFLFSPAPRYVYLRVPSFAQQPSATLSKYVFYSTCFFCLCHLYPTSSRNSSVFIRLVFFSSFLFLGWRFLVVVSYPVR